MGQAAFNSPKSVGRSITSYLLPLLLPPPPPPPPPPPLLLLLLLLLLRFSLIVLFSINWISHGFFLSSLLAPLLLSLLFSQAPEAAGTERAISTGGEQGDRSALYLNLSADSSSPPLFHLNQFHFRLNMTEVRIIIFVVAVVVDCCCVCGR